MYLKYLVLQNRVGTKNAIGYFFSPISSNCVFGHMISVVNACTVSWWMSGCVVFGLDKRHYPKKTKEIFSLSVLSK